MKNKERRLLVSRIQTPDGTILTSEYRHDIQFHRDKNGELYFIDGGTDYMRTSSNNVQAKDVSIYSDSPFTEIRQYVKRGTFNKAGERVWIPVCNLSDEHLVNILKYNKENNIDTPDNWFADIIREEIEYRKQNNISVPDGNY